MRTNGFAVFRGPHHRERADGALPRVQRYCKEVVVEEGPRSQYRRDGTDRTVDEACSIVACSLDGERGPPLLHGFLRGDAGADAAGEFALLRAEDGPYVASRDTLGTRPLYADERGSCIASDHRFFDGRARLLPNGARLEVEPMRLTASPLSSAEFGGSLDECAAEVAEMLTEAVATRVAGKRRVAVSFSGGLDSALIALLAAREVREVVLCSAYASGSRDERHAKLAAESLGLELIGAEIDATAVARELRALDLPFEPGPMDRALWCIYSTTARMAAECGAELIMLGQLADELFGGYMKYARAAKGSEERAAEMMRADVLGSGERAFIRDEEACARFTEVRFPFADERLASFALGIPVSYKIEAAAAGGDGVRKLVLRKAAALLGLPEELAAAPKKAAQYSSGVAKLVS